MADLLELAQRALARRELTPDELRRRLRRAGAPEAAIEQALQRLVEVGYLSEERAARERARLLAERGYGDAFIRADLAARGVAAETVEAALATLPGEEERAQRALARVRGRPAAALRRRGFAEETIARLAGPAVADEA